MSRAGDDRRTFLSRLTLGMAGVCGAAAAWPVARYVGFVASENIVTGADRAVPVMPTAALEPGGAPLRVAIHADNQRDAWTRRENAVLGAAWILMDDRRSISAFSAACPHLGCSIGWSEKSERFECPCHDSAFARDGSRLGGPAKRGLDPLPLDVQGDQVLVKLERFVPDIADRRKLT